MLCGGLGTRLRPVVTGVPKPLAPIAGRCFLEWLLQHLSSQGLRRFILCSGYLAENIDALEPTLSRWGEVVLSPESEPLGTGGALRNAMRHARSGPFFVLNGDSFANVDMVAMLAFHQAARAQISLAVVPAEAGQEGGALTLSRKAEIQSFEEKGRLTANVHLSAGIYLMDSVVLSDWPGAGALSLERDVFPQSVGKGIFGFVHSGALVDIGTPDRYRRAEDDLRKAGLSGLQTPPRAQADRAPDRTSEERSPTHRSRDQERSADDG